jgi:protein-disulfide isomerase
MQEPTSAIGEPSTNEGFQRARTQLALVLSAIGIFLAIYAAVHHIRFKHLADADGVCNISALLSCDRVIISRFSEVVGIPLGVWGAGYYAALLLFHARSLYRRGVSRLAAAAWVMPVGGALISAILIVISTTAIGALCPVCICVYICNGALLAISLAPLRRHIGTVKSWTTAGALGLAAVVVAGSCLGYLGIYPHVVETLNRKQADDANSLAQADRLVDKRAATIKVVPFATGGEDITLGYPDAAVTLVEFVDFGCPNCAAFDPVLRSIHATFGPQLQIVLKHFPLDETCNPAKQTQHPGACNLALVAQCSAEQRHFWATERLLFQAFDSDNALPLLAGAGVDMKRLNACRTQGKAAAKVRADAALGSSLGVSGTPALFVNGRQVLGGINPFAIEAAIREAFAAAKGRALISK